MSKTLSFKILYRIRDYDGNGEAVVQDPPPDPESYDEADASVDSVPRWLTRSGPAPVFGGFTNWLLISTTWCCSN